MFTCHLLAGVAEVGIGRDSSSGKGTCWGEDGSCTRWQGHMTRLEQELAQAGWGGAADPLPQAPRLVSGFRCGQAGWPVRISTLIPCCPALGHPPARHPSLHPSIPPPTSPSTHPPTGHAVNQACRAPLWEDGPHPGGRIWRPNKDQKRQMEAKPPRNRAVPVGSW